MKKKNNDRKLIKLGLTRIKKCLQYLDNPQEKFKSVIIGGTNGKGSVTFYLSNIADKYTNLKIGRYTSPHLISWEERITINEVPITREELKKYKGYVLRKINRFEKENKALGELTEFEIYTVIAFYYFFVKKIDIALLEVGLGGRLDATNVISPKNTICSIITNISVDHTNYLGKNIKEIAYEKAGIIKKENILITGAKEPALSVIRKKAKSLNTEVFLVKAKEEESYINKNINIALQAWKVVSKKSGYTDIKQDILKNHLEKLQYPGRFQYISSKKILLDGAHNSQAALELKKIIRKKFKKKKKIIYIIGMLDKDYRSFIKILPEKKSTVICTEPKSQRATRKDILIKTAKEYGLTAYSARNLKEAITQSKQIQNDLTVIAGSLYLVGEGLKLLKVKVSANQGQKAL